MGFALNCNNKTKVKTLAINLTKFKLQIKIEISQNQIHSATYIKFTEVFPSC